jgi:hypothetical protein
LRSRFSITIKCSGRGFAPIVVNGVVEADDASDALDEDNLERSGIGHQLTDLEKLVDKENVDHLAFEVHRIGPAARRVPKKVRG